MLKHPVPATKESPHVSEFAKESGEDKSILLPEHKTYVTSVVGEKAQVHNMSAKKTHEGGKTLKSYDLYYYCTVTVLLQRRVLGAWNEDGDVKQEENKNNSYWQKKRKPLPAITPKN